MEWKRNVAAVCYFQKRSIKRLEIYPNKILIQDRLVLNMEY